MKVNARKRLMRRVVFAACLLDVLDFDLTVIEDEDGSYLEKNEDGTYLMSIEKDLHKIFLMEHVAHEVVHLAQYVRGDLVDAEGGSIWKGQFYPEAEHGSDEYYLAPWEMEARALQAWIQHKWETRSELH